MLRQQLQQYQEAPKANMTAAASKSPDLSSGIGQYQQQSSYEDSTYKYQAPIQKYQDTIADNKYKRDRQESSSRYDAVPQAHTKQVSQVRSSYSSYADNSPSSHDSSPHMAHSSPSAVYTNSSIQQTSYPIYNQPSASSSYRGSTNSHLSYSGSSNNVYNAASPVEPSIQQQSYSMPQAPSPVVSAANPYSKAQAAPQNSQIIQAQADSTTKPKKGRGSRSSVASSSSRSVKKKRSQEADLEAETAAAGAHLQQQLQQQQQHVALQQQQQSAAMTSQHHHAALLSSSVVPGLDGTTLHIPAVSMSLQHPGLETMPSFYELPAGQQYSEDMLTQVHMANELLGINHQDIIRSNDHSAMFLTNTSTATGYEGTPSIDAATENDDGMGLTTHDYRRYKQRTKAEQKEMPGLVSRDLEDEFGHLSQDARKGGAKKEPRALTSSALMPGGNQLGQQVMSQPVLMDLPERQQPPAVQAPPVKKKQDDSFQSSFLSFIQGNKQETLSSVTNSAIVKKPDLPKYIPEPPRPKPKPQPPETPSKEMNEKSSAAPSAKKSASSTPSKQKSSAQNVKATAEKIVQGVMSSYDSANKGSRDVNTAATKASAAASSTATPSGKSPIKLKIKMSNVLMPGQSSSKSRKRSSPKKRRSNSKKWISDDEDCVS